MRPRIFRFEQWQKALPKLHSLRLSGLAIPLVFASTLAALLLAQQPTHAQESVQSAAQPFSQQGGLIIVTPLPPPVPIDVTVVRQQLEAGCRSDGAVRFGDMASMRGTHEPAKWPDQVRERVAASTFADSAQEANAHLEEAKSMFGLTDAQRMLVDNRQLLSALQFRAFDLFDAVARELAQADMPPQLLADRLFLLTYRAALAGGGARDWKRIDEDLVQVLARDNTFFAARVLRMVAWYEINARAGKPSSCVAAIGEMTGRMLQVSEASICPSIAANYDHFMERWFADERLTAEFLPAQDQRVTPIQWWHQVNRTILAGMTRNRGAFEQGRNNIASAEAGDALCAPDVLRVLDRIEAEAFDG